VRGFLQVAGLVDHFGKAVSRIGDALLVLLLRRGHDQSVPHVLGVHKRVERYYVHEAEGAPAPNSSAHQGLVPCAHSTPMTAFISKEDTAADSRRRLRPAPT
jgi:hypothetical protein